jgi:hypothetical protein
VQVGELFADSGKKMEKFCACLGIASGSGIAPRLFNCDERKERRPSLADGNPDERDTRQFAFQILGVSGSVSGMMQYRIDVIKNALTRDAAVSVKTPEHVQHFRRNVIVAILFFSGVSEQRKALCLFKRQIQRTRQPRGQYTKCLTVSGAGGTNSALRFPIKLARAVLEQFVKRGADCGFIFDAEFFELRQIFVIITDNLVRGFQC